MALLPQETGGCTTCALHGLNGTFCKIRGFWAWVWLPLCHLHHILYVLVGTSTAIQSWSRAKAGNHLRTKRYAARCVQKVPLHIPQGPEQSYYAHCSGTVRGSEYFYLFRPLRCTSDSVNLWPSGRVLLRLAAGQSDSYGRPRRRDTVTSQTALWPEKH